MLSRASSVLIDSCTLEELSWIVLLSSVHFVKKKTYIQTSVRMISLLIELYIYYPSRQIASYTSWSSRHAWCIKIIDTKYLISVSCININYSYTEKSLFLLRTWYSLPHVRSTCVWWCEGICTLVSMCCRWLGRMRIPTRSHTRAVLQRDTVYTVIQICYSNPRMHSSNFTVA